MNRKNRFLLRPWRRRRWGPGQRKERFVGWDEPHPWSFTAAGLRPEVFSKFVERVRIEPVDDTRCRIVYRCGLGFAPLFRPFAPLAMRGLSRAAVPTLEGLSEQAVKRMGQTLASASPWQGPGSPGAAVRAGRLHAPLA
ncbi:SRPBCC family protein [Streptomyces sp. NRRL B-1347]|uniref:SRPBCC family protein n=1 Tax=Streptomyces sp. NRRL B-1347 TaxID=1476877 RepID=UPI0004C888D3|nr:SRPBCC family protein [Streptomyces sp. NRRL B-1347]